MTYHDVFHLFTQYGWTIVGSYRWQLRYDHQIITAHVGGPSDHDLWVSFSTKTGTLPLVIRDKETLETYLAPI